jgi:hypothetical protein
MTLLFGKTFEILPLRKKYQKLTKKFQNVLRTILFENSGNAHASTLKVQHQQ